MARIRKNFVASQPATEVNIVQLIAARVPLKITDVFQIFPDAAKLNHRALLNQMSDFNLVAARLKSGSLDLSAPETFDITTFSGKNIMKNKSIWHNFYFSEPLSGLPGAVTRLIPYPFGCNLFTWFKGRLWLAGDQSRTPLHRDIPHNMIFVTEGAKDVMLVAPHDSRQVYGNRLFSKAPNFAQIDVRRPDLSRFPRQAGLNVFQIKVAAGEILYIPPFWWHDIKNVGKVTSINYWFAPVGIFSFLAAISYAIKKILGIYKYAWRKPA